MIYTLDFEFSEYFIVKGILWWKKKYHVIEPISLGIVCEDGRELDILFNDFNVNHAWNKHDVIEANTAKNHTQYNIRNYWLRDNVLKPIQNYYGVKEGSFFKSYFPHHYEGLKGLKYLLKTKGITKKQAADKIKEFCREITTKDIVFASDTWMLRSAPEFWAYFADYDWVVFCSLFGRMLDLPTDVGFPMYCNDLKQLLEQKAKDRNTISKLIKERADYPQQTNEHLAIDDARWNIKLYNFLMKL